MFPNMRYSGYEDDELIPKKGKRPGYNIPVWKGLTGGDGYLMRSDTNQDNWYTQTEWANMQHQKSLQQQENLKNNPVGKWFWEMMNKLRNRDQEAQGGTSYFPHYSRGGNKVASPAKPQGTKPPQVSTSQTMVNPRQYSRYSRLPGQLHGPPVPAKQNKTKGRTDGPRRKSVTPRYSGRR